MQTVTQLKIHNIGPIPDAVIPFNEPLLIFFGKVRQGKTTVLNAIRWCFGGEYPDDIIRHGEKEAYIELATNSGCVRREFYRGKSGDKMVTKVRELMFIRDGRPVDRPAAEIKRMLNPFQLNQDFLRDMSEPERKRYFAEMFAVDTKELDMEQFNLERECTALRAKIEGYGDLNITPVEPVDVERIKKQIDEIRRSHSAQVAGWRQELNRINSEYRMHLDSISAGNAQVITHNAKCQANADKIASNDGRIKDLAKQIEELKANTAACEAWLKANPPKEPSAPMAKPDVSELEAKVETTPDTADLEAKLSDAKAQAVRYENYLALKAKAELRRSDEASLTAKTAHLKAVRAQKLAKLKSVSDSTGIPGLDFDDSGNFSFEGTDAGMLSTSQIMRLSSALSALYPEGFSIELVDRAESLGEDVYKYIDYAKDKKRTVLATVVGDSPAKVPAQVGVFVVENGEVKPKQTDML